MGKKYQVYEDKAGQFRFRLRAENNKIVAVSQGYKTHASCINGVESVQKNCGVDSEDLTIEGPRINNPKYQIFYDKTCGYRFHLNAPNGEIIATSEGYTTKEGCINGINAVKNSCDAEIEDLSRPETEETKTAEAGAVAEPDKTEEMPVAMGYTAVNLMLNKIPENATEGETVWFEGKITRADNNMGIKARININDEDQSFFNDQILTHGYSKEDGTFKIDWIAEKVDWWDDTAEVYAEFPGTKEAKKAKTPIQKMVIK
jgi:uncharacterized protein YegP (UPF0339 family)